VEIVKQAHNSSPPLGWEAGSAGSWPSSHPCLGSLPRLSGVPVMSVKMSVPHNPQTMSSPPQWDISMRRQSIPSHRARADGTGDEKPFGFYTDSSLPTLPTPTSSHTSGRITIPTNPLGLIDAEQGSGWLRNVSGRCSLLGTSLTGATSVTAVPTTTWVCPRRKPRLLLVESVWWRKASCPQES
jgi:hypothetical protein